MWNISKICCDWQNEGVRWGELHVKYKAWRRDQRVINTFIGDRRFNELLREFYLLFDYSFAEDIRTVVLLLLVSINTLWLI